MDKIACNFMHFQLGPIHMSIFYFLGHNVLPKNHLQKVVNDTLFIEGVQKDHDVGEYTCTAKNSNGQGSYRHVYVNVVGWYS